MFKKKNSKSNFSKTGKNNNSKTHSVKTTQNNNSDAMKKNDAMKDWFYMAVEDITVEQLEQVLTQFNASFDVEIWKELSILELTMENKQGIDFVQIECDLDDEYSNAFLKEHKVKRLYQVSVYASKTEAKDVMEAICRQCGGLFCADTQDFKPMISC